MRPAVVIVLELESPPRLEIRARTDEDLQRLVVWHRSQPELKAIVLWVDALERAAKAREARWPTI